MDDGTRTDDDVIYDLEAIDDRGARADHAEASDFRASGDDRVYRRVREFSDAAFVLDHRTGVDDATGTDRGHRSDVRVPSDQAALADVCSDADRGRAGNQGRQRPAPSMEELDVRVPSLGVACGRKHLPSRGWRVVPPVHNRVLQEVFACSRVEVDEDELPAPVRERNVRNRAGVSPEPEDDQIRCAPIIVLV
jgi:hypothetical protein